MLRIIVVFFSMIPMIIAESNESNTNQKRFLFDGDPLVHYVTPYRSTGSLTFLNRNFYLGGKPIRILSGSFHYFRAVPEHWKDILLKMKACGLNTVQTYVPWNLHEEYPGQYNFQGRLNLRNFIQLAHEVGLYVIFRPGPYICAEWDFGGLPAWLLKDKSMKVRTNYPGYTQSVERYFTRLLREVADLQIAIMVLSFIPNVRHVHLSFQRQGFGVQYSKGGPIIAVQVENEFGSYSDEVQHLMFLKKLLQRNGIVEMMFASDGFYSKAHTGMDRAPFYTEALTTANFQDMDKSGYKLFDKIRHLSPDFPLMVTEFWSGWFDQWGGDHQTVSAQEYSTTLKKILETGASVNFYMFYGGTSFGFMPGANWDLRNQSYFSDVTSYDYDAPLNEAGDVTRKYNITRDLIKQYVLNEGNSSLPDPPQDFPKEGYGILPIKSYLDWNSVKQMAGTPLRSTHPVPMEYLPYVNGTYGQNFGFVLYAANITTGSVLNFTSIPKDRAQVFIDGVSVGVLESWTEDLAISLPTMTGKSIHSLEILVENRGRVNFMVMGHNTLNEQRKGLLSDVLLDNQVLVNWTILPLEFSESFIESITRSSVWRNITSPTNLPAIYQTVLNIKHKPKDTFLWMKGWQKGVVFVNGFNLGRYWHYGPQQTLYIPEPLLRTGDNHILIFELHSGGPNITFRNTPVLGDSY